MRALKAENHQRSSADAPFNGEISIQWPVSNTICVADRTHATGHRPSHGFSLTHSRLRDHRTLIHLLASALLLMLIGALLASSAQAAAKISTVGSLGIVGPYTSLVLDGSGFPVSVTTMTPTAT